MHLNEVLAMEPEITDPENTKLANKKSGYVEFKNISFRYPGSDLPAISHINFSVKPGETTAIIGGTGSGKSTLVREPEIYIFDDSFSALDFKTDARLRGALKIETSKATVLIVAQRVATVMAADRIIVL